MLGAGLKPGPGLLGRGGLRFERGAQSGLVPFRVLPGLCQLPVRVLAGPVPLGTGRLGHLGRGGLRVERGAQSGLVPFRVLPGLCQLPVRVLAGPVPLGTGRLGHLGRGGLRVDRGAQSGLVPFRVLPGLRQLPVRVLAGPVPLRTGRLGHLGCSGLRAADRIVAVLPHRGHLLLSGPLGPGRPGPRGLGLLLGSGLRRQRLGQLRISLRCGKACLLGLSLGPLAAPPEPGPRTPARTHSFAPAGSSR